MKYKGNYKVFNVGIDGTINNNEQALAYARGMVWSECETTEQSIKHATHVDTIDGGGVYYDYGADYYFFTDESGE